MRIVVMKRVGVPLLAPIGALALGCSVGADEASEDLSDQYADELSELESMAETAASGEGEDTPYTLCQIFGDCAYCEDRIWQYGWPCTVVCYSWSCYEGADSGGDCYLDCSLAT